jgi:exopolyphosphatase/guanosine-5'-triphosphate,3'-diphosphate pyrophosphatase
MGKDAGSGQVSLVSGPAVDPPVNTVDPVAIIDIGSNSARIVAYARDPAGRLRILASSRAALRLVEGLDAKRRLGKVAIARALEVLRDFSGIARGAGARRIVAVATAAMREASDAHTLLERAGSELAIEIRIIDGEAEGRYGFLGGARGLPVESGLLFDMGGGSLQLSRFENRAIGAVTSLPLGALRLALAFLKSDPPRHRQVRAVLSHVKEVLETARIAPLGGEEVLVGTGGTIRNLAKIDREGRRYPIARVHGYSLKRRRVARIAALLADRRLEDRARVPGLSDERADSIVAGAFAIDALMRFVRADRVLVSGFGVREGLAYSLWSEGVPTIGATQEASVASLSSRFWGVDPRRGARRAGVADALLRAIERNLTAEIRQALSFAARLLDIGATVDFFDRHRHAADIVLETELDGFSHRQIAIISAVIRCAGKEEESDAERYSPLLHARDFNAVRRASVVLALAEDIEARLPEGVSADVGAHVSRRHVRIDVPALLGWRPQRLGFRFARVFGRGLIVRGG